MTRIRKLYGLLTIAQRRATWALLGLMLIAMALETLSIGLVIPALALMTQGDLAARYPAVAPVLDMLGNPSPARLIIGGMMTLVVVYAVKTCFIGFLAWRQARFVCGMAVSLSERLFAGYLRQPYTFHLQRNSAQLIRNTIGHVTETTSTIQQGLLLTSELLVAFGVFGLLMSVEPIGALLIVSILGLAGGGFYSLTRGPILRWGEAFTIHEGLRIQRLQEGLSGVKDVKVLGRESDFLAQYGVHNVGSARLHQHLRTLSVFPRLWLELLAVCGLAAVVVVMVVRGRSLEALPTTLGLFAAAAFRLMPSVNRVMACVQSLRFASPVIDRMASELRLVGAPPPARRGQLLPFENVLTLDRVCFQYEGAVTLALRGVSLSISRGTSVGFVGGSGAGKSTLVDVILGLFTPVRGTIRVDGVDIQTNVRGWQDQVGYVPQSVFLTDDTLRRNIAFGLSSDQIDEAEVWRAVEAAQLCEFVNDLPQGLDTFVGERGVRLSGGQRQRIGIARALYHDPPVLVLDEATSSLDTRTERDVMDAVRALHGEKTILIVAHRLSTVAYCDQLFRLEDGKLIEEETELLGNVRSRPVTRA